MAIFSPSRRPQSLRQIQILILEILQCIPVVKILIFLDLPKTISFLDGHCLRIALMICYLPELARGCKI